MKLRLHLLLAASWVFRVSRVAWVCVVSRTFLCHKGFPGEGPVLLDPLLLVQQQVDQKILELNLSETSADSTFQRLGDWASSRPARSLAGSSRRHFSLAGSVARSVVPRGTAAVPSAPPPATPDAGGAGGRSIPSGGEPPAALVHRGRADRVGRPLTSPSRCTSMGKVSSGRSLQGAASYGGRQRAC